MKVPLRLQMTEFDCGTTSLENAFSYLYEREELPAAIIKAIHRYTLDSNDIEGNIGNKGTSRMGVKRFLLWLEKYCINHDFKVSCRRYEAADVTEKLFKRCLFYHGCILIRCWLECEHYVIVTKIENDNAYIFDPYYLKSDYYANDKNIRIIIDEPFKYNRIVTLTRLFSVSKKDLSLGPIANRECVLINR